MREPKKVPLEVGERFVVLGLLPEKANFLTLKLLRELKEALVLSEEEQEAVGMKPTGDGGGVVWDAEKAKELVVDIPFDSKTLVMVIEALEKLDKDAELEVKHASVYEKFVLCEEDAKGGPQAVVKA